MSFWGRIKKIMADLLKAIPVFEFHHCYEDWNNILQRYVGSKASYIQEINIEL